MQTEPAGTSGRLRPLVPVAQTAFGISSGQCRKYGIEQMVIQARTKLSQPEGDKLAKPVRLRCHPTITTRVDY